MCSPLVRHMKETKMKNIKFLPEPQTFSGKIRRFKKLRECSGNVLGCSGNGHSRLWALT